MASQEECLLEYGGMKSLSRHSRMAHSMSSSSLRRKSDITLISKINDGMVKQILSNIQEVVLGTKLCILFPAVILAVVAKNYHWGRAWIFSLSLLGLIPLAERLSFLTEQIAFYTGPTVGGLLNATCGNAPELIISIFALSKNKINVVKYSLLGSILSNLLLVLGTSLLCGGIANLGKAQNYDKRQADVNSMMLLMGLLCHLLPLLFRLVGVMTYSINIPTLELSRAESIVMLIAYIGYLFFQLWTHRQLFEASESEDEDNATESDEVAIGFWSGVFWLLLMTVIVAFLSEYIVATIEDASKSWSISVSFLGVILLPIVGNAAEHAGAIIFAFRNKYDISLGVALGSSTQVSMFVVPVSVIVAWIIGIDMDLDFDILETGSLALSIIITAFALQGGTNHYMKGVILLLSYLVISACFFVKIW